MSDQEERLRKVEERLRKVEVELEEERLRKVEEEPEDLGKAEGKLRGAKPQLAGRPPRKLEDGSTTYRAEVFNYGKGIARDVRWCLVDKEGDMLTTVAGGDGVNLAHREHVELEVTVLDGVEDRKWQVSHSRLTWRDARASTSWGRSPSRGPAPRGQGGTRASSQPVTILRMSCRASPSVIGFCGG